jgi:hypothetical protein
MKIIHKPKRSLIVKEFFIQHKEGHDTVTIFQDLKFRRSVFRD